MNRLGFLELSVKSHDFDIVQGDVLLLLHGPSMLADRPFWLVLYNQSIFISFDETSSYLSVHFPLFFIDHHMGSKFT